MSARQYTNLEYSYSKKIKEEQEEICTSHDGEQLEVKQRADTLMLTPNNEESDHMEPEPDSDQQLLSHSSTVAENPDRTGSNHVDSVSNRNAQSKPQRRRNRNKVENCQTSESETHIGEKSFKYDICEQKCAYKSELMLHVRVHTGEKTFFGTCSKGFKTNSALLIHMRTHTGEKPYSCKTCGKCFSQSTNLTAHERIHTGEKPYTCKTRGKNFTLRSTLITHMKIHSDEKPYSCKTCGKCFRLGPTLIVHRTHTGEKPYSCETWKVFH